MNDDSEKTSHVSTGEQVLPSPSTTLPNVSHLPFGDKLARLGFANYEDYIASPIWKGFKARYQHSNRSHKCAVCGSKKVELHHQTYIRLGCEELGDVVPLCNEDHEAVHALLKAKGWSVESTPACIAMLVVDPNATTETRHDCPTPKKPQSSGNVHQTHREARRILGADRIATDLTEQFARMRSEFLSLRQAGVEHYLVPSNYTPPPQGGKKSLSKLTVMVQRLRQSKEKPATSPLCGVKDYLLKMSRFAH